MLSFGRTKDVLMNYDTVKYPIVLINSIRHHIYRQRSNKKENMKLMTQNVDTFKSSGFRVRSW